MKRSGDAKWQRETYRILTTAALGLMLSIAPSVVRAQCAGDCDNTGKVTIDDILTMVDIALGTANVSTCTPGDTNHDSHITIDEILAAVNNALTSCPGPAVCGNGITESGEECDDGGTCIGNAKAGQACTSDSECGGIAAGGVCLDGGTPLNGGFVAKQLTACTSNADCGIGGTCVACKTFGGDGCAANCTLEHNVAVTLATGQIDSNTQTVISGSGATIDDSEFLGYIGLPLGNACTGDPTTQGNPCSTNAGCGTGTCIPSTQVLTIGSAVSGTITGVIKANSVKFAPILVPGVACACVHGVDYKTCGGTLYNTDGTLTTNCTDGYGGTGAGACAGGLPCTDVFGPGNSAQAIYGCVDGAISNANMNWTQDHIDGGIACTQANATSVCPHSQTCVADPTSTSDTCGAPLPVVTFSGGPAPAGSAIVLNSAAIGTTTRLCAGSDAANCAANGSCVFGADGLFCTADDPIPPAAATTVQGLAAPLPLVTGTATGTMTNAYGTAGATEGPDSLVGVPLACSALSQGNASGGAVAGSFTQINQPMLFDYVTVNRLAYQ
ncbi:MAG: hypothetical protein ACHQ4J_11460 [Candidatus Binatia bacterium]